MHAMEVLVNFVPRRNAALGDHPTINSIPSDEKIWIERWYKDVKGQKVWYYISHADHDDGDDDDVDTSAITSSSLDGIRDVARRVSSQLLEPPTGAAIVVFESQHRALLLSSRDPEATAFPAISSTSHRFTLSQLNEIRQLARRRMTREELRHIPLPQPHPTLRQWSLITTITHWLWAGCRRFVSRQLSCLSAAWKTKPQATTSENTMDLETTVCASCVNAPSEVD